MSTKLKLLGCDVASFGVNQPKPDDEDVQELVWNDPFKGIYRKLIFNKAGTKLRGGILVGDADDYSTLHKLAVGTEEELTESQAPGLLLTPPSCPLIITMLGTLPLVRMDIYTLPLVMAAHTRTPRIPRISLEPLSDLH